MSSRLIALLGLALCAGAAIVWLTREAPPATPMPATTQQGAKSEPIAGTAYTPAPTSVSPTRESLAQVATLEPAHAGLRGRVVDARHDGRADVDVRLLVTAARPIADLDAAVRGEPLLSALTSLATRTAADGTFAFANIDPTSKASVVVDPRGAFCSTPALGLRLVANEWNDLGDLVVDASPACAGRVVDAAGQPIANAVVRFAMAPVEIVGMLDARVPTAKSFVAMHQEGMPGPPWTVRVAPPMVGSMAAVADLSPEAISGADGRFSLYGLQDAAQSVLVRAESFAGKTIGNVRKRGPSEAVDLGDMKLERGETLAGTVVDAAGRPVANARVCAGVVSSPGPTRFAYLMHETRTNADGAFTIDSLPVRPHVVAARRDGDHSWTVAADVEPGLDPVPIALTGNAVARIAIVDEQHAPVADPRIAVHAGTMMWDLVAMLGFQPTPPTEPRATDGALRVAGLAAGEYTLLAYAPGFQLGDRTFTVGSDDAAVELVLKRALPLAVHVRDARDGKPVPSATVEVLPTDGFGRMSVAATRATTDASGTAAVERRLPRTFALLVEGAGFAATERRIATKDSAVDVDLTSGGTLVARVRDGGAPLATPRTALLSPKKDSPTKYVRSEMTDATGGLDVEHLAAGAWTLAILRDGVTGEADPNNPLWWLNDTRRVEARVDVNIADGQETALELDLQSGARDGSSGRVQGTLTINGAPARAKLTLDLTGDGSREIGSTRSDSDGRFDFGVVPSGRVRVYVELQRKEKSMYPSAVVAAVADVPQGGVVDVPVALEFGSLTGRVTDANGSAIADARVSAAYRHSDPKSGTGVSGYWAGDVSDVGAYEFLQLPAGANSISVEAKGFVTREKIAVNVPRAGAATLDVQLQRAAAVSGTVVLDAPLEPHRVLLVRFVHVGAEDDVEVEDDADEDGKFSIGETYAGSWKAVVELHEGEPESRPEPADSADDGELKFSVSIHSGYSDQVLATATIDVTIPPEGLKDFVLRPKFVLVPQTDGDDDDEEK